MQVKYGLTRKWSFIGLEGQLFLQVFQDMQIKGLDDHFVREGIMSEQSFFDKLAMAPKGYYLLGGMAAGLAAEVAVDFRLIAKIVMDHPTIPVLGIGLVTFSATRLAWQKISPSSYATASSFGKRAAPLIKFAAAIPLGWHAAKDVLMNNVSGQNIFDGGLAIGLAYVACRDVLRLRKESKDNINMADPDDGAVRPADAIPGIKSDTIGNG